jgi:predicted Mrr-cat superfamily restriction endonuclease
MDVKEASALCKETSLYEGMGAQFGAQIWRMAHEARVGDYIYLESENHNLQAVGVISGPCRPRQGKFDDGVLQQEGPHACL